MSEGTAVVIVRVVFMDGGQIDRHIKRVDFGPRSVNTAIALALKGADGMPYLYDGRLRQIAQVTVRNG